MHIDWCQFECRYFILPMLPMLERWDDETLRIENIFIGRVLTLRRTYINWYPQCTVVQCKRLSIHPIHRVVSRVLPIRYVACYIQQFKILHWKLPMKKKKKLIVSSTISSLFFAYAQLCPYAANRIYFLSQ